MSTSTVEPRFSNVAERTLGQFMVGREVLVTVWMADALRLMGDWEVPVAHCFLGEGEVSGGVLDVRGERLWAYGGPIAGLQAVPIQWTVQACVAVFAGGDGVTGDLTRHEGRSVET